MKINSWKAIAAMSENRVIGINNRLPWSIPSDIEWFKRKTKGQLLVMGSKTYESYSQKDETAFYIVVSRQNRMPNQPSNVKILKDIDQLMDIQTDREIWICGGSQIFTQTLHRCSELYLTVIKKQYEGDTYFPVFENQFKLEEIIEDNESYSIRRYKNKLLSNG